MLKRFIRDGEITKVKYVGGRRKATAAYGSFPSEINQEFDELLCRLDQGQVEETDYNFYATLLRKCGDTKLLPSAKRTHRILTSNVPCPDRYLRNLMVEMYGKCGSPQHSNAIFNTIMYPNVHSWTMLILAYGQNAMEDVALKKFQLMDLEGVMPNQVTFVTILTICSRLQALSEGMHIHSCAVSIGLDSDVVVRTVLVSMYAKCSRLDLARQVFETMAERNVVSWNSIITAYVQHGHPWEAIRLFRRMELDGFKADEVTFICLLEACTLLVMMEEAKKIYERATVMGYGCDVKLATALLTMYGKYGNIDYAKRVFDGMKSRNVVSWNAMIAAYAQHGMCKLATGLYKRMEPEGIEPDDITFVSVLNACSSASDLVEGKMIHAKMVEKGLEQDVVLGNCLVNMYGRCGSLEMATEVFVGMHSRSATSWNSIMTQYSEHGEHMKALTIFRRMELEGVAPDDISLISILSVCSHAGLLREGKNYFMLMREDYGITLTVEHCGCMVDLLGRVGRLHAAEELLRSLPGVGVVAWTALLNACRLHGNADIGSRAAREVLKLDPKDYGTYAMLLHIYRNTGRLEDAAKLRKEMQEKMII